MDIDFKKIIAWLKRNKIGYTIKDNSIVLFNDSNGKVELVFNPDRITPKAPRGVLMPSSAADGSEFYVKVGDWGKWIDEFLAWAKDRGYYEYNHYRNSQWGTWKFGNFISMSFFGAFIKKIIALKNGVNESMKLDEAKQILNKNGYIVEKTGDNLSTTQKLKNVLVSKLQENGYTDLKASRTKDLEGGIASKFKVLVNGGAAVIEYNDYDEEFTVFIGDEIKTLYLIDEVIEFLNNNLG